MYNGHHGGRVGGGIGWEFGIDMCTLLYMKHNHQGLLSDSEDPTQYSVIT